MVPSQRPLWDPLASRCCWWKHTRGQQLSKDTGVLLPRGKRQQFGPLGAAVAWSAGGKWPGCCALQPSLLREGGAAHASSGAP